MRNQGEKTVSKDDFIAFRMTECDTANQRYSINIKLLMVAYISLAESIWSIIIFSFQEDRKR